MRMPKITTIATVIYPLSVAECVSSNTAENDKNLNVHKGLCLEIHNSLYTTHA